MCCWYSDDVPTRQLVIHHSFPKKELYFILYIVENTFYLVIPFIITIFFNKSYYTIAYLKINDEPRQISHKNQQLTEMVFSISNYTLKLIACQNYNEITKTSSFDLLLLSQEFVIYDFAKQHKQGWQEATTRC